MIVRADLPVGVAAAQIVHAAGESSPGDLASGTYAVVLQAKDEFELDRVAARLTDEGVEHVVIHEPDEPWCNAAMAIGIRPALRSTVWKTVRRLQLYGEKP